MEPARAISIAGSDPSGGAGIQADVRTMASFGVFCATAVTSVTVQNTFSFRAAHHVAPDVVAAQIDAVMEDLGASAAKTGMLPTSGHVLAAADRLQAHRVAALVVDPVMVATSGGRLMAEEALKVLRDSLLPLATVVTPNLDEAAVLAGFDVGPESLERAARVIRDMGPANVVITGGHLEGEAVDLLFDGSRFVRMSAPRLGARRIHGAGCAFSAAIAAGLAKGWNVATASERAKEFVTLAISSSLRSARGSDVVNTLARRGD